MDDERWEQGEPVLDRQPIGAARGGELAAASRTAGSAAASTRPVPPRGVPETRPIPLQKHYALLGAPALVLGAIALTAVELGTSPGSLLVRACVLVAAPLLAVANADALLQIWRSTWAWMPVGRGRGLFRLAWFVSGAGLCAMLLVIALGVLLA